MKNITKSLIIVLLASLLAACSGSSNIQPITPLPTQTEGPTASATPESASAQGENGVAVASLRDDLPAATATTRLEATLAAATATQAVIAQNSNRSTGQSVLALATSTLAPNRYEPGEARAIALATDTMMLPDIDAEDRLTFDANPVALQFNEFYSGFSMRTGLVLSEKLRSLDGETVIIEGYVAPPLKPLLDFFVLTRIPLSFCPFCSTDVEWPDDIALVYLPEPQALSSEFPVRLTGQLEIGSNVDAETGMVSLVRIYADTIEVIN